MFMIKVTPYLLCLALPLLRTPWSFLKGDHSRLPWGLCVDKHPDFDKSSKHSLCGMAEVTGVVWGTRSQDSD